MCELLRPVTVTSGGAVWEAKRRGWDESILAEFTMADAEQAGYLKGKEMYRTNPADMRNARAYARACRRAFPDLVGGLYVPAVRDVIDVEQMPDQGERVAARIEAAVGAAPASASEPEKPKRGKRKAEPTVEASAVPEPERDAAGPDPAGANGMLTGLEDPGYV